MPSEPKPSARSALLESTTPARPPHPTLLCALDAGAREDVPWLTLHNTEAKAEPKTLTLRQLRESAHRYAHLLHNSGVQRGDRVLLLLPTGSAFIEAMLGTMLAGAVPVPLAGNLTFGAVERYLHNLKGIADSAEARLLITSGRMRETIAGSAELCERFRHVLTPESLEGLGVHQGLWPSISETDTAFIQYTSGTTGKPKGAVISHRALVSNAYGIAHGLQIGPESVGISWLPLFHDMGLIGVVLTSIAHPYPIHLMPPERFVMQPRGWLELIAKARGTLTAGPNFAYEMAVARSGGPLESLDLSCMRTMLNGAEPVHEATLERFVNHYAPARLRNDVMLPVYGLAESTLAVAFPSLDKRLHSMRVDREALESQGRAIPSDSPQARSLVSVGVPLAGTSFGIFDDTGRLLPEGEVGEIRVRSASLMDGYFHNEEASREALSDGELRTGDLGVIRNGLLYVTGRKKDLIIKGGRNIHPYDVERIAERVNGMRMGGIAAFARPNAKTGTDDLVLAAETMDADDATRERIQREIRGEVLAVLGVKVDDVHFCRVGTLPRTTSGKLKRKACATLFTRSEV
jgi:acyl-CoA synthetase (AMP-forming)/AMP-acid ligase II